MNFLQSIFGTIHQKTPRTGLSRKDTKKARKLYEDGVKLMLTDDGRERGKQYCLQAAEMGDAVALLQVGLSYIYARLPGSEDMIVRLNNGLFILPGLEADISKGLDLLEKSGKAGNSEGYYMLGMFYSDPDHSLLPSIQSDAEKAFEYYHLSAEMGHVLAQQKVGSCYLHGSGVKQDIDKALEFLQKAADGGDVYAYAIIGSMYLSPQGCLKPDTRKAFEYFYQAAKMGLAVAQFNVGQMFEFGDGTEQDLRKSITYYRLAAEQEHSDAQYRLGLAYLREKKVSEAFRWVNKAAKQGNVMAFVKLGDFYSAGIGTRRDEKTAEKWYRKAVDAHDPVGEYALWSLNLIRLERQENGDPQNTPESLKLLLASAEQGHPPAQNAIGCFYRTGNGVPKDERKAVEWFRKAAEQGNEDACLNLYNCYRDGIGVEKDAKQAMSYLNQAAEYENASAFYELAVLCEEAGDHAKASELISKAAEQGHPEAIQILRENFADDTPENQNFLGMILLEREPQEAAEWFRKAAEQGNADAQYNLGMAYYKGDGVDRDRQAALMWFKKAADAGVALAQYNFGAMCIKGKEEDANELLGVKYIRKAAEQGNVMAENFLGFLSFKGSESVPKDYEVALHWWTIAAEQGDPEAMNGLGFMYACGMGVKKDIPTAQIWFQRAMEYGSANAEENISMICASEDGDEQAAHECLRQAARHGNLLAKEMLKELKSEED